MHTTGHHQDMLLGVFQEQAQAEAAIQHLESQGFKAEDISIVMQDRHQAEEVAGSTGARVTEGAASGATTGAVVGGLAGLLIGIGAIAIPGIGAILIGGPLAAALGLTGAAATTASGALTGALAGGLVGALVGLGVSEEDAQYFEQQIKAGAILLAVPTSHNHSADRVHAILEQHGAQQVREVGLSSQTNIER